VLLRYPERLTLFLGDPSVLVPRFITLNPNVRCGAMFIDGSVDDFVLRDTLVDFRELADFGPNGHFVAINVPSDLALASTVASAINAAVLRGVMEVHAVVRGGILSNMADIRTMNDAEYMANTLVVAKFRPLEATKVVPPQP
jgi:hypothetical protein